MENAADALKMAGSVLLFVMALSICVVAFSQARESIDLILAYSDRESLTIENDSRFYYLSSDSDTSRYVGKETIIPAIYRSYKENYKIVFEFDDDYYLFEKNGEQIKTIYLATEGLGIPNNLERAFLNGIIYHDFSSFENSKAEYEKTFEIKIDTTKQSLFEYLSSKEASKKIKESLGTYYVQDVGGTSTEVEEVNKTEKRVITYEFMDM